MILGLMQLFWKEEDRLPRGGRLCSVAVERGAPADKRGGDMVKRKESGVLRKRRMEGGQKEGLVY